MGSAIHPAVSVRGFPSKFWASWPDSNKTSYKFYIIRKHPNVLVFLKKSTLKNGLQTCEVARRDSILNLCSRSDTREVLY